MNSHQQYATALAIAVGRLVESPEPGEPQKAALRTLLAISEERSVTFRLYGGVLTVDDEAITDDVTGAAFLRHRLALHGVSELVIARHAEADELLAVVRGLASEGGHGRIKEKLRDAGSSRVMVIIERDMTAEKKPKRSVSAAFAKVQLDDAALAEWNRFLQHGVKPEATFDAGLAAADGQVGGAADGPEPTAAPSPSAISQQPAAPPAQPPPASGLQQPPTLQMSNPLVVALAGVMQNPYGTDILSRLTQLTRHLHDGFKDDRIAEVIDALNTLAELEAKAPEGARNAYAATFNRLFNGAVALQIVPYLLEPRRANRATVVLRRAGTVATEVLVGLIGTAETLGERMAYFRVLRGIPKAPDRVLALLGRSEWQVVRNVAELIGEAKLEEGVTMLCALLDHQDQRVRRTATIAIAKIGTAPTVEPLRRLLSLKESTPEFRAAIAQAIGGEQARALTAPLLALAEAEPNADVAKEFLRAIGRIGTVAAVQALQKAAEPGGKLIARKPLHLRLGGVEGLRLANAVQALETLLQDGDRAVREAARQALEGLGKQPA